MAIPKKILVPLDFSDDSEKALEQAVMLAKLFKATVYLFHVVENRLVQCIDDYCLSAGLVDELAGQKGASTSSEYSLGAGMGRQIQENLIQGARENMQKLAAELPDAQGIEMVMEVASGHPAEEILKEQERHGADLIVMPSKGTGRLQEFFLGSTAEKVVRQARCTVMVIKG